MDGLFNPIYYTAEHRAFASSVKRFVEKEISPYVNEWDEAGIFPRELYHPFVFWLPTNISSLIGYYF